MMGKTWSSKIKVDHWKPHADPVFDIDNAIKEIEKSGRMVPEKTLEDYIKSYYSEHEVVCFGI